MTALIAALAGSISYSAYALTPGSVDLSGNPNLNGGILRRDYSAGYFGDDPTWFNGHSPSATSYPSTINIGTGLDSPSDIDNYSIQWTGYFTPASTGTYIFRTTSDDGSYFWIGFDSIYSYTTGNANVKNGGAHSPTTVQGTPVNLTANRFYPVRAQFGEISGGASMYVEYSTDNGATWNLIDNLTIINNTADGYTPFLYATKIMNLDGSSYGGSGTTWTDSIGSKAFTLQNSPTWSSTNGGQFRFDAASSQYATLGEGAGFNTLSSWTVQSVVKLSSLPSSGKVPCIITEYWQRAGQSKINFAQGFINGSPILQGGFFDSGNGFWNVSNAVASASTGTWYDLVTTYDGPTHTLKQYVNGTYIGATTCPGTPGSSNPGLVVAKRWDVNDYLDCTIKAINIWDGVLIDSEVTAQHVSFNSLV